MRILIADDDNVSRLLVSSALGDPGHQIVEAEDGEAAWRILKQSSAPQLVVLDWMMRRMDGLEVVRKVRSERQSFPCYIILLTRLGSTEDIVRGLDAGADDYLGKLFNPSPDHISTSYVERQNWTVRTNMRRDTRLSSGFSRKFENHAAAVALNYLAYNFVRLHRTLRVTPAMAAGVTDRLWDVSDLVSLLEEEERRTERAA